MKKSNKWGVRTIAIGLVASCLLGGVVLASTTTGGQSDPIVSLSYFTQRILPDLLKDGEKKAETTRNTMTTQFDKKIDDYTDEVADMVTKVEGQLEDMEAASAAAYSVVTLVDGESIALDVGAEVMLRIGSATVTGGSPALIDTTGGIELGDGGSLVKNHLYLCTIDGRTLTGGAGTTKVLLRK